MALLTFNPQVNPSYPAERSTQAKVNIVQFGDGYNQRSTDGLNYLTDRWMLTWETITAAQARTLDAFFRAHVATAFLWTPFDETVARKFIVDGSWRFGFTGPTTRSLSVTFIEVFDATDPVPTTDTFLVNVANDRLLVNSGGDRLLWS
jgi:phage-related protein